MAQYLCQFPSLILKYELEHLSSFETWKIDSKLDFVRHDLSLPVSSLLRLLSFVLRSLLLDFPWDLLPRYLSYSNFPTIIITILTSLQKLCSLGLCLWNIFIRNELLYWRKWSFSNFYCIVQDFFWSIEPVYSIFSNLLIHMYLCSPINMGTLILFC